MLYFPWKIASKHYTFGGSLACLAESEKDHETHLAALTGTDTIVVP